MRNEPPRPRQSRVAASRLRMTHRVPGLAAILAGDWRRGPLPRHARGPQASSTSPSHARARCRRSETWDRRAVRGRSVCRPRRAAGEAGPCPDPLAGLRAQDRSAGARGQGKGTGAVRYTIGNSTARHPSGSRQRTSFRPWKPSAKWSGACASIPRRRASASNVSGANQSRSAWEGNDSTISRAFRSIAQPGSST